MVTRKNFLQRGALSLSTLALANISFIATQAANQKAVKRKQDLFDLGIAGYSFVHFSLEESLAMMKRMNVRFLCIKDFHLAYKSSSSEIADFHKKLDQAGVVGYAVGPIYMKSTVDIDNAFEYAKRVGVKLIVGIPNPQDLDYVSKKVEEYDMRYAIHNHGPEDELYPNASVIYNLIKDLDARVGICFDIGHNQRDGQDPVKDMLRYHKRIFDIHLKDITSGTEKGAPCELGRGVIDISSFVKALRKVNYADKCSLEHEKDMKDPIAGLAESAGYFRGVLSI